MKYEFWLVYHGKECDVEVKRLTLRDNQVSSQKVAVLTVEDADSAMRLSENLFRLSEQIKGEVIRTKK